MHYISGPLAVLFLGLATLDTTLGGSFVPSVLLGGGAAHVALAGLVLGLLYAGKLLSLGSALFDSREAKSFGGRGRLLASAMLEQMAALIISAMLIVFYTRYVVALLFGQAVRWDAQPRDDRGLSWSEGWLRLRGTLFIGVAWLLVLLRVDAALLDWCAPLLFGLFLALPAAILSSRTTLGSLARRLGLFLTPEELSPASILRAYSRAMAGPLVAERPHPAISGLKLAPSSAEGD
jgi:membrane glycosyltransferase